MTATRLKPAITLLDVYPDRIGELIALGMARCPAPIVDVPLTGGDHVVEQIQREVEAAG
jgi:hypothetical protein